MDKVFLMFKSLLKTVAAATQNTLHSRLFALVTTVRR